MSADVIPLESAVETRVRRVCKDRGAFEFKGGRPGSSGAGMPDRIICFRGYFIGCEVKRPGGKPTPLQLRRLKQIIDAGGIGIVVNDSSQLERLFDQIEVGNAALWNAELIDHTC